MAWPLMKQHLLGVRKTDGGNNGTQAFQAVRPADLQPAAQVAEAGVGIYFPL
jgi:hypothetical protein